ncbi:hypothetical protein [Arenicella xantha]|uniref:hypothetical protein n=1 Tax=Arenicella xantha TaxID=644221 RepID=UPI00147389E1|nr:hypothetical protein [Arenicella xantha]
MDHPAAGFVNSRSRENDRIQEDKKAGLRQGRSSRMPATEKCQDKSAEKRPTVDQ